MYNARRCLRSYWITPRAARDDARLIAEVACLPPLGRVSASSLSKIMRTLRSYDKFHCNAERGSVAKEQWKKIREDWFASAQGAVFGMRAEEQRHVLVAVSNLEDVAPLDFLDNFQEALRENFFEASPCIMAKNLYNFATMNVRPKESFLQAYYAVSIDQLPQYMLDDLSSVLYAFAKLRIHVPEEYWKHFLTQSQYVLSAENKRLNFNHHSVVSKFLWALAVHSVTQPLCSNASALGDKLLSVAKEICHDNERSATTCHYACLRLFPDEASAFNPMKPSNCISVSEIKFKSRLEKCGMQLLPQQDHGTNPIFSPDYVASVEGRRCCVEYDGYNHFVFDVSGRVIGYDGGTVYMSTLFQALHPDVMQIRVPDFVGKNMGAHHIRDLSEIMGKSPASSYLVTLDDKMDICLAHMPTAQNVFLPVRVDELKVKGYHHAFGPE